MIGEILKPGDNVLLRIEAESREWGYNPYPDDTKAVVLGPTESIWGRTNNCSRRPGVYPNHSWMRLRLENGEEVVENNCRLFFADPTETERRMVEYRANRVKEEDSWEQRSAERIRDLPETPFCEWDSVEWRGQPFAIKRINYNWLKEGENFYAVSPTPFQGGTYDVRESELTLISRGKIWKYYNGVPVEFDDIGEEDRFFRALERYECVKNPRTGNYGWRDTSDCVSAVRAGVAHSYTTGISPYGIRFLDKEMGERVAKAILSGYQPLPL